MVITKVVFETWNNRALWENDSPAWVVSGPAHVCYCSGGGSSMHSSGQGMQLNTAVD